MDGALVTSGLYHARYLPLEFGRVQSRYTPKYNRQVARPVGTSIAATRGEIERNPNLARALNPREKDLHQISEWLSPNDIIAWGAPTRHDI